MLDLPGEIRNRIYRHAVTYTTPVVVDAQGVYEPALLRSCSQVRREALTIYNSENMFHISFPHFHASIAAKWTERVELIVNTHHTTITSRHGTIYGGRNWDNLREWFRLFHCCKVLNRMRSPSEQDISVGGRVAAEVFAIGMVFEMLDEFQDLPWERVARLVDEQHRTLMQIDMLWA